MFKGENKFEEKCNDKRTFKKEQLVIQGVTGCDWSHVGNYPLKRAYLRGYGVFLKLTTHRSSQVHLNQLAGLIDFDWHRRRESSEGHRRVLRKRGARLAVLHGAGSHRDVPRVVEDVDTDRAAPRGLHALESDRPDVDIARGDDCDAARLTPRVSHHPGRLSRRRVMSVRRSAHRGVRVAPNRTVVRHLIDHEIIIHGDTVRGLNEKSHNTLLHVMHGVYVADEIVLGARRALRRCDEIHQTRVFLAGPARRRGVDAERPESPRLRPQTHQRGIRAAVGGRPPRQREAQVVERVGDVVSRRVHNLVQPHRALGSTLTTNIHSFTPLCF